MALASYGMGLNGLTLKYNLTNNPSRFLSLGNSRALFGLCCFPDDIAINKSLGSDFLTQAFLGRVTLLRGLVSMIKPTVAKVTCKGTMTRPWI